MDKVLRSKLLRYITNFLYEDIDFYIGIGKRYPKETFIFSSPMPENGPDYSYEFAKEAGLYSFAVVDHSELTLEALVKEYIKCE